MKSKKLRKLVKLESGNSEVLAYTGHHGVMTFESLNKENKQLSPEDGQSPPKELVDKKEAPEKIGDKTYYKFRSLDEFENRMQKSLSN